MGRSSKPHELIQTAIALGLREMGYDVQTEVKLFRNRVDVFARRGEEEMVVEVLFHGGIQGALKLIEDFKPPVVYYVFVTLKEPELDTHIAMLSGSLLEFLEGKDWVARTQIYRAMGIKSHELEGLLWKLIDEGKIMSMKWKSRTKPCILYKLKK